MIFLLFPYLPFSNPIQNFIGKCYVGKTLPYATIRSKIMNNSVLVFFVDYGFPTLINRFLDYRNTYSDRDSKFWQGRI